MIKVINRNKHGQPFNPATCTVRLDEFPAITEAVTRIAAQASERIKEVC